MPDALLEIGCEEIPARFVSPCLEDLTRLIKEGLAKHRIVTSITSVSSYATYRRLAILITGLKDQQDDIDDWIQGPPLAISKSDAGEWLPPAIGFAKKCGVSTDDFIEDVSPKGQPIICIKRFQKGVVASEVLPTIYKTAITQMKLPIAMVWGRNQGPFIRPIQWICSLLENQTLELEIFGIKASNCTYGHRFLSQSEPHALGQAVELANPNTYVNELIKLRVMVDINQRKQSIRNQLQAHIEPNDEGLLQEVVDLAECPTVLSISFPAIFLKLPKEVLLACLKKHQKAFLVESNGELNHSCLVVADSVTEDNKHTIIAGNQRVMLARLNDVQFFWQEDLKTGGFDRWNQALQGVVFQDGLGSLADKVKRMGNLARVLMNQLNATEAVQHTVDRAVACCKADLVSQMVMELPALQGIMGGFYARAFNESEAVAQAISDHYSPRFDADALPASMAGAIVSIVDRLDTMVACYENNAIPTGSRDPWGIRRSMIAIIRMVIHFRLNVNITHLLEAATHELNRNVGNLTNQCGLFFKKRFETVMLSMDVSADVIQWVQPHMLNAPLGVVDSALVMMNLRQAEPNKYALLVESMVRIAKIIDGVHHEPMVQTELFEHAVEKRAYESFEALLTLNPNARFEAPYIPAMLEFCEVLTEYFEQVLVHTKEQHVALNRQTFLNQLMQYFYRMGDWQQLIK